MERDAQLRQIYYDSSDPGSYGGLEPLLRRAKEEGLAVNREQVKEFLRGEDTYTLHKTARRHYPRNRTIVGSIDKQWQADLADMQKLSRHNSGHKYLLTVIDCFSRYAWAIPVKSKDSKEMVRAFNLLFKTADPRKPERLQTDKGKEFLNKDMKAVLREHDIHHFTTNSDTKAAMVERFNRTLKTRMWRYFTAKNTYRYLDVLPNLLKSYNSSLHRSIGMRPCDVRKKHENAIWVRLYGSGGPARVTHRESPALGATVRLSKFKTIFDKGYLPNWTTEEFKVTGAQHQGDRASKRVYKLTDKLGEEIQGRFYKPEIQEISENPDKEYKIERVIKKRKIDGDTELLVKWQGLPDKLNSWVKQSEVSKLGRNKPAPE